MHAMAAWCVALHPIRNRAFAARPCACGGVGHRFVHAGCRPPARETARGKPGYCRRGGAPGDRPAGQAGLAAGRARGGRWPARPAARVACLARRGIKRLQLLCNRLWRNGYLRRRRLSLGGNFPKFGRCDGGLGRFPAAPEPTLRSVTVRKITSIGLSAAALGALGWIATAQAQPAPEGTPSPAMAAPAPAAPAPALPRHPRRLPRRRHRPPPRTTRRPRPPRRPTRPPRPPRRRRPRRSITASRTARP